jgi:chromosomal replication initiation ATPase DnaA
MTRRCAGSPRLRRWPDGRLLLAGPAGTGKSHLLHATAQAQGWALLRGPELRGLPEAPTRGVALDEADLPGEEAALLHLMNACAEAKLPLLMAAPRPPSRWRVALADLRSRLAATAVAQLDEPSDALLDALLAKHLADRQVAARPRPARHPCAGACRAAPAVMAEAVARLDRASLIAGRRLTRRRGAGHVLAPLFR